ncbi:MAG: ATP-dependent zinc metalloprotease FtsH [Lachnospiraceae bacterium]|nr:ATP-dependent zinc metalloprotease FtsH [Lachnospiraceae bacterium]
MGTSNNDNKGGGNKKNDGRKNGVASRIILTVILFFIFILCYMFISSEINKIRNREITYGEFLTMLEKDEILKIEIQDDYDKIVIYPRESAKEDVRVETYYTGIIETDSKLTERLEEARSRSEADEKQTEKFEYKRLIVDKSTTILDIFFAYILPFVFIYLMLWGVYRMFSKNGGIGGFGAGKSTAKMYVEKETGVTFKDVAGQEEAKESVLELVDFLHDPAKYTRIGAKLPKGALLVGPPGTGKTLLAKAVAGEAKVPFFSLSGSDFVEMYVGVGASRVRDLFRQAQQMAPCIVFIDEIDAIGKSRDSRYGGGNDEREQTLNQLLAEMDGFDTSKGVVILAATNRPEILDKALLRPGRFDRRIIVDKPDLKGRLATLKVHSKNVLMHDSVDLEAIALATSGAVGSDLANIINEAAILAVKEGRTVVQQSDLMESVEVVFAGKEKKDRILGPEEKRIVAFHEVGHALVAALQKGAEPVQKITIVPRTMGALGYTMQVPEEEKYLSSKNDILREIRTLCGGRAAEAVIFNSITTGASNDIERATSLARQMITMYGMSDEFGMVALETIESRYLDGRAVTQCSDQTATKIDTEVKNTIGACYADAERMLRENIQVLEEAAEFLIEKETITGAQFMEIFRRVRGEKPQTGEVTSITLDESETDETPAAQDVSGDTVASTGEESGTAEGAATVPDGDETGERL